MAACAGLVDGRSRQTSGSASAAGSDGSTWRRNRLAALPPFRQETRRAAADARAGSRRSRWAPRCGCRRPGCLRARTLAARPTRPRRPASSAPAARHSPAPDRSPGSRPRSARRRCADARSSGPGAAEMAPGMEPSTSTRACGVVTGAKPLQDRRVRRRRPVLRACGARPGWRPPGGRSAVFVFSCRKDSARRSRTSIAGRRKPDARCRPVIVRWMERCLPAAALPLWPGRPYLLTHDENSEVAAQQN